MHVCGTKKDYISFHSKVVVSNRQWVGEADQVAAQSAHNLVISSSANCLPFSPLRSVRGKVACSRIHLSKYHVIKCHREFSFSPSNKNSKHHLVAKNHMDPGMFLFVLPPLHENDYNNVHEERTVTIMRMRLKTIVEIMPVLTCIAPAP